MALEQTPLETPPQKSQKKLLVGLVALTLLMYVLIAVIIIHLTAKKT